MVGAKPGQQAGAVPDHIDVFRESVRFQVLRRICLHHPDRGKIDKHVQARAADLADDVGETAVEVIALCPLEGHERAGIDGQADEVEARRLDLTQQVNRDIVPGAVIEGPGVGGAVGVGPSPGERAMQGDAVLERRCRFCRGGIRLDCEQQGGQRRSGGGGAMFGSIHGGLYG